MPAKCWIPAEPPTAERDTLAQRLGVSPLLAHLLVQRGIRDEAAADRFLHPSLDHLHDPLLLPDCGVAVERLARAVAAGDKILVHGDYDVDGVCAAALLTRVLRVLKANVEPFVPHRRVEGYDLRPETVRRVAAEGVKLIVTVDCGTVAFEAAEAAKELGVALIITDHHEPHPDGSLPEAAAIVNPKRLDSRYPFPELCGTGVAFKLATALVQHAGVQSDAFRTHYLDLVALATCADCMPLVDENRVFVKLGLEALRRTRKPGLKALMKVADIQPAGLTTRALGFQIGPRINAIGRIDAAAHALRLMLTGDDHEAGLLAARLDQANSDRQQEQERILREAMRQAERFANDRILVLASQKWHPGIIGIVASKITEALYRPTVMIALGDEEDATARGSCRSIEGFHIFDALHACRRHMIRCGGHQAAAGFDVAPENVEALREALQEVAGRTLGDDLLTPRIVVDAELPIDELDFKAARELELLEPFGHGNHQPVFVSRGVRVREQFRIASKIIDGPDHLKLKVQHPRQRFGVEAVYWRAWARAGECTPHTLIDACYTIELSQYNGYLNLQLNLLDMECVEAAPSLPISPASQSADRSPALTGAA